MSCVRRNCGRSFEATTRSVEAALTRWADIIARGGRLSPAELLGQRFTPKFRGYDPGEVKAVIDRLIAENT